MLAKGGEAGSRETKWPSYEEQSLSSSLNQPPPPAELHTHTLSRGEDNSKKTMLSAIYFIKNPYLCEAALLSATLLVFHAENEAKNLALY